MPRRELSAEVEKSIDAEHLSVHSRWNPKLETAAPPNRLISVRGKLQKLRNDTDGTAGGLRDGRILPLHSRPRPSPDPVD